MSMWTTFSRLEVRRLLDDKKYETNEARAEAFSEKTKAHRATFYRHLAQIKRYRPLAMPRAESY